MTSRPRFQLAQLPAPRPNEHRSHLLMDGILTRTIVPGDTISAQIKAGSSTLLITNYDYYEAVTHWYHLIDAAGKVLDTVSTPDYFGFLQELVQDSDTSFSFGFFGTTDRWSISVVQCGYWAFRPSLRVLAKRYLRLEKLAPSEGLPGRAN